MTTWLQALKKWNGTQGSWCIPRRGSPEYLEVRALMMSDVPARSTDESPDEPDDVPVKVGRVTAETSKKEVDKNIVLLISDLEKTYGVREADDWVLNTADSIRSFDHVGVLRYKAVSQEINNRGYKVEPKLVQYMMLRQAGDRRVQLPGQKLFVPFQPQDAASVAARKMLMDMLAEHTKKETSGDRRQKATIRASANLDELKALGDRPRQSKKDIERRVRELVDEL